MFKFILTIELLLAIVMIVFIVSLNRAQAQETIIPTCEGVATVFEYAGALRDAGYSQEEVLLLAKSGMAKTAVNLAFRHKQWSPQKLNGFYFASCQGLGANALAWVDKQ